MPWTDPCRGRARTSPPAVALAVALILAGVSVTAAQIAPPMRNYGGDRLESRVLDTGERVTEFIGNAYFEDQDLRADGDLGRYYSESRLLEIVGDVIVRSDSLDMWTDSLRVFRDEGKGFAYGSVRIETEDGAIGIGDRARYDREAEWLTLLDDARVIDGANVVEGDSILIRQAEGTMEAWGSVKVVDEANRTVVEGRHGFFDRETGLAVVDSLPVFRSRRGTGPITTVKSDWLGFDETEDVSTAIGDVDFVQGATQAHADTARFYGEDLLVLDGAPTVQREGRVMSGEQIRFTYVEGDLERIDVYGQASLVDSTPDTLSREFTGIPLANTLSGDTLVVIVTEGEITRTSVRGNARSEYLPEDQTSTISVNEVEGRAIDITFDEGQVDRVNVEGQVSGIYRYLERRTIEQMLDEHEAAQDSIRAAVADSLGAPRDSVIAVDAIADTVAVAEADTMLEAGAVSPSGRVDFESLADVVEYSGQATLFEVQRGRIHISDQARVKNESLELFAEDVYFDTDARELLAEGDPRLVDANSELVGDRMGYLFDPQTGAVANGATRFDQGFYTIRHGRRIDSNTLLAEDGIYTECELEEPHYHFHAQKMKLKVGQSVVARQVTFYVSDIPLMTLPFFYKDLKRGRRSGILFPQINVGVNSREGRYVRDFGYYWATNEYTDFRFEFDFNERREASFQIENVYNVRYGMSGNVDFTYLRRFEQPTGGRFGDEWRLRANHNQPDLFDVWRANANLELSSSNLTTNLSDAQANTVLESELRSRANVSRSFDNGSSLSLGVSRTQRPNSEDDDPTTNNRLVDLNTNMSLGFKTGPLLSGRKRDTSPAIANLLRDIQFSQGYGSSFQRNTTENGFENRWSANGRFGLTYSPDSVGPFKLTSSANFSEAWSYTRSELDVYESVTVTGPDGEDREIFVADPDRSRSVDESDTRPSLSFNNSIQSDLYGVFPARVGDLRAIRHQISYSATHSFRPKLGDDQEQSQSIGLRLNNDLSFKVRDGDRVDAEGREQTRKLQRLITWSLNTSVNPEADPGEKWSPISSAVSIRPGVTQAVSFSMNQSIDPYTFDVTSTRMSSTLRLRGDFDLGGVLRAREERQNRLLERLPEAPPDSAVVDSLQEYDPDDDFMTDEEERREREQWLETGDGNRMPWDLNVRGSLTQTRQPDGSTTTRANTSLSASLSLPGEWKMRYSAGFDIERGEFTNQSWSLNRRLHHWRLEFRSEVAGAGSFSRQTEFGFRLYLEPLPDISVDRGSLARGGGFGNRLSGF
jgi:lipopolysaccharide assembly outer membrane protein LptD (OstA)